MIFRISRLTIINVLIIFSLGVCDSGGNLSPEQAAYDVNYYELNLKIEPQNKSIAGFVLVRAKVLSSLPEFILDLDGKFTIDSVLWYGNEMMNKKLIFEYSNRQIRITLPFVLNIDGIINVAVYYHGHPKEALNPPWDDGFIWTNSPDGKPWVGVACEAEGADIWWPCKDHPSDEADSLLLNFTVPEDLKCVSNGKFLKNVYNRDNTKTVSWFVSNPINNYDVTFYLGEYERIPVRYIGVCGDTIPSEYWFLRNNAGRARKHIKLFLRDIRFLEETCGPFPFRADKYGVAEAPYRGMEHQTIIAYGNNFQFNEYGFDYIHFHELAHEWWGNLVTAKDWADAWIHEGFATYMEALYTEHLHGQNAYKKYMAHLKSFSNRFPIAPHNSITAEKAFSTGDIYYKAAWIIHTLRYYLGDDLFFRLIKRWAYPEERMESIVTGEQCRFATTEEFRMIAEEVSLKKLSWFFDAYFRQASLPQLLVKRNGEKLQLQWKIENDLPFYLPVEVKLGDEIVKVAMNGGKGEITIAHSIDPVIDPDSKITMQDISLVNSIADNHKLTKVMNFDISPNPFNKKATIKFFIPKTGKVIITVYNILGRKIKTIFSGFCPAGEKQIEWDGKNNTGQSVSGGVYLFRMLFNDNKTQLNVVQKGVLAK
jgi:aminopeptidase N